MEQEAKCLNFYHTWIYEYFLNTGWFIWTIVVLVMGGNILAPIILWFLMSRREIPFFRKRNEKVNQGQS
jgi:hypothetical protein